ncbi:MAG TPA: hypothetical protein VK335_17820 [Bryobacteraceae bacterium]|nr:hypothetical protein [Bryobacteraceae bacterium]
MGTAIALAVLTWYAAEHPEAPEVIMAKVAQNQDRAQEMRKAFVYHQSLLIRFKRGNGKLAREEQREYTVTPSEKGFKKDLVNFTGKYEKSGKLFEYNEPGFEYKGVDIDGELANEFANDLANDKESRDGITNDLFALTGEKQKKYTFKFEGKENYRGTEVYRITFKPKKASLFDCDENDEGGCWAGEALIDTKEYQPVLVTSWLAKSVPMAVQVLLGTNIKHLGFKVAYQKFADGLWFPVTYGGEFYVRGVFFYKRTIAISVVNSGFQKSDVTSTVSFQLPTAP